MAQKKISDLTLASAVTDASNFAGDLSSQTFRFTGAQIKTYIQEQIADLMKSSKDLLNLGLAASVSGNALTVALKTLGGSSDPSSTTPVKIGFRGTTAGNGDFSLISGTAAASVVVSSGSTLGCTSAVAAVLYVYAINNGGTIELAISKSLFDEGSLQTSVAEGGAGAADSATVLYSASARTSKAIRLIGSIKITEATAGTWASAPTELSVAPFNRPLAPTIQKFTSGSGTYTLPSPAPLYLRVRMVGGGGGGGGSADSGGSAGGAGGDSTFGTTLLVASGGALGAISGASGGAGGTASLGTGPVGIAISGGSGGSSAGHLLSVYSHGGAGGVSALGGAAGSTLNATPVAGATNSGSGGAGGGYIGTTAATISGCGGGAGGFVDAIITSPLASYSYAVGAAGTAGTAGVNGTAGSAGGSGLVEVTEYYS